MQKFVINMVIKHYSTLEVEADNIEEARDIVEDGELARNGIHLCKMYMKNNNIVRVPTRQDYEDVIYTDDDVVIEYYDSNWNDI